MHYRLSPRDTALQGGMWRGRLPGAIAKMRLDRAECKAVRLPGWSGAFSTRLRQKNGDAEWSPVLHVVSCFEESTCGNVWFA